ncbi:hypothetical protein T10_7109 [Trichinella papuae]|uniref:Uncharacterized protein n=1 Tax=Trichinella papuae TaxID=268474 RepID=A0A0V1MMI0_9BILA|nr:hypothetical protein T10_7109 [Trichinella papuae]
MEEKININYDTSSPLHPPPPPPPFSHVLQKFRQAVALSSNNLRLLFSDQDIQILYYRSPER